MIERVNRQITIKVPPSGVVKSWTYNLPRTSLLEVSYRIKPINFKSTAGSFEALQLAFGSGSPPDFGLGGLQTMQLTLPPQLAPLFPWEEEVKAAETQRTNIEDELASLRSALARAKGTVESAEDVTKSTFALYPEAGRTPEGEIAIFQAQQAQGVAEEGYEKIASEIQNKERELARQNAAIAELELQKPSGWTSLVAGTFQRSFDALRLSLIASPNAEFVFEETLEAYRPEDIGPTYTRPLEGG